VSPQTADDISLTGDLSSIGQVAITVKELPRAIRFYRDALGLPLMYETPEMAFFRCGDLRLMLGSSQHGSATYSSIVYYNTSDIHQTTRLLQSRGVVFEAMPRMVVKMSDHDLWMAFFHDSEGNLAALMSEVR
jgi:predicted enzyme related to lactoylglutathione lyase